MLRGFVCYSCNRLQMGAVHTIADIARLAGVSKSTVSRALDDSPLIAAETRERVKAIAREHDFHRNVPARRLSLQQSHAIALVTYEYTGDFSVPDAFMLEIQSGISSALHASDYDLLVVHVSPDDNDWPRRYLESGRTDGFILLWAMCTRGQLDTLVEMRAPFIIWGMPPARPDYCSVSGDNMGGGRVATEHLLRSGRRRIAFLTGADETQAEVADRLAGYRAALAAAGLDADPALVVRGEWQRPEESSAEAVRELLERAPDVDALFANSDLLAIGAMDALRRAGRTVPDDVAVIGYDDIAIARFSHPPLTTVRQNGPLAGRLLAGNLIQHLETGVVTNVSIPAELVVRESA
jgi:DNA-binding LacI/PurR family transcriptional regulator